tara:strand:+ start:261 stop:467 length:207 start_codon:yes stop_codon:yes gene_type:complete
MVKKIRLIEDEVSDEQMDANDIQKQFLELAKSMDWKLWELLQTMQRLEKGLRIVDEEPVEKTDAKTKK